MLSDVCYEQVLGLSLSRGVQIVELVFESSFELFFEILEK